MVKLEPLIFMLLVNFILHFIQPFEHNSINPNGLIDSHSEKLQIWIDLI